jgi:hypothetical protein
MECGAILDVVRLFDVAPAEEWNQALLRVVEMLSKMS